MKRFITALTSLALMLGCLTPNPLFAAESKFTEHTVSNKRYVFANGNDVVIEQDADGKTYAALKNDKDDRILVDKDTFLFAGAEENGSYDEVTIEMKSGVIGTIIGSNKGPGSIGTSNIIIDNGAIGMAVGNQGAKAKEEVSGGGAASYEERKKHAVQTVNITMNGGSAQALVPGSYGYTYVGNANVTVNGGTIAATTSPMQAGVLGGTNGETENLTINFHGGTTKDIAFMQRTMITGKATVNVDGGSVGDIYAGSYYDDGDNAAGTNNWNGWGIGDVNYGQAAAIEINIGDNAAYDNIFAGFQYLDKEKFESTYKKWIATINGSEIAPLTVHMGAEPTLNRGNKTQKTESIFDLKGDFINIPVTSIILDKTELSLQTGETAEIHATVAPSPAKDKRIVWKSSAPTIVNVISEANTVGIKALRPGKAVITATAGDITASCEVTVENVAPTIPQLDTSKPFHQVEAGLNDEAAHKKLDESITKLSNIILQNGETNMVDKGVADVIKKGLENGRALSVEVITKKADMSQMNDEVAARVGSILEKLSDKNNSTTGITQYLDLEIQLKLDGEKVGSLNEVSTPLEYSVALPSDVVKEGRTFHIVRIHNGKAEILPTTQKDNILTFSTDKFSTYAVIYEDKKADEDVVTPEPNPEPTPTPAPDKAVYNVVFVDMNGAVLKSEKVKANSSATAPKAPEMEGYRFVKWDNDFTKVTRDLLVKPIYEKVTTNTPSTEEQKNDKKNSSPDTGDTTTTGLFSAFALLGLISMAIVVTVRKKGSLRK
ncbi:Ig-like domain-containing protein [[Clostridium] innocuum]|nr:Ig-like domain-containing protein [[Clostridium] innocuum]